MRKHKITLNPCRRSDCCLLMYLLRKRRTPRRERSGTRARSVNIQSFWIIEWSDMSLAFFRFTLNSDNWRLCIRALFYCSWDWNMLARRLDGPNVHKQTQTHNEPHTLCRSYYLCQTLRVDEYGLRFDIDTNIYGHELYMENWCGITKTNYDPHPA